MVDAEGSMYANIRRALGIGIVSFVCGVCVWSTKSAGQEGDFGSVQQVSRLKGAAALPKPEVRLTRPQVVRLGIGEEFQGNVVTVTSEGLRSVSDNIPVRLLKNGRVVSGTKTDKDGRFAFQRLEKGLHTLVVAKDDLLAVQALVVIYGMAPSDSSFEVIAATGVPADRTRAILAGLNGVAVTKAEPQEEQYDIERESVNAYQVELDAMGGFRGSVFSPGQPEQSVNTAGVIVRVLRNGKVVAETQVENGGDYEVKGVGPGPASILMFGKPGFAAMGIELVAANFQTALDTSSQRLVAKRASPATGLNVDLAPIEDVEPALDDIQSEEEQSEEMLGTPLDVPPPMSGGGFAGGGGGGFGGGGGGGGSGLAGLVGLGAIAASLAAGLSSGGDDGFTPPPASPATP